METLIRDKDEDGQDQERIQQGITAAEGWANGELVALLEPELAAERSRIPAQRRVPATETYEPESPAGGSDTDEDDNDTQSKGVEGGKALYGAFGSEIETAGGVSIKGLWRGRDIVRYRNGRRLAVGRQTLRVFPGNL